MKVQTRNFQTKRRVSIIEFAGKKSDWECWPKNFSSQGKQNGYKKLSTVTVDKSPIQAEFEQTLEDSTELGTKNIKLVELDEVAYKNRIISINFNSSAWRVAF